MSAHTPGPWKVQPYVVDLFGREVGSTSPGPLEVRRRIIADDSPMIICDMVAGSNQDANIIAAAPEMLEALIEIAHGCLTPAGFIDLAKIDRVARAAIAKARGGK